MSISGSHDALTRCCSLCRVDRSLAVRAGLDQQHNAEAHQTELVARLTGLGATSADVGQGDVQWTVLADPEGNMFCVLEPRSIYQDTGPTCGRTVVTTTRPGLPGCAVWVPPMPTSNRAMCVDSAQRHRG